MTETSEFTVHHLRFEVEALTPLALPAHAGPSLRGALFGALQRHFCPAAAGDAPDAGHKAVCPVCWLMATDKPDSPRGRDVPRPYTVEPPIRLGGAPWSPWRFEPGQRFAFGLTLFAQALSLFPYLVVAMPLMGQAGLGIPIEENAGRRGSFVLRRIDAVNPLTGRATAVMGEGQTMIRLPDAPVTARDVEAAAETMAGQLGAGGRLRLHFWTPTRIVDKERLAHRPWLGPLFRRLLERLDALRGEFAAAPPIADRERLVALADSVRLVQDSTQWLDLHSGSRRLGRATPVGGFVGEAGYQAPELRPGQAGADAWQALLPYLVWGQEVHVGKSATKGDGWYEVGVENGG